MLIALKNATNEKACACVLAQNKRHDSISTNQSRRKTTIEDVLYPCNNSLVTVPR